MLTRKGAMEYAKSIGWADITDEIFSAMFSEILNKNYQDDELEKDIVKRWFAAYNTRRDDLIEYARSEAFGCSDYIHCLEIELLGGLEEVIKKAPESEQWLRDRGCGDDYYYNWYERY